jgi:hypothetical protein
MLRGGSVARKCCTGSIKCMQGGFVEGDVAVSKIFIDLFSRAPRGYQRLRGWNDLLCDHICIYIVLFAKLRPW